MSTHEDFSRSHEVKGSSDRGFGLTVGGILLLGGLGYAFDRWQGTEPWGLVIGLVLGVLVGFYSLIKTVWRR